MKPQLEPSAPKRTQDEMSDCAPKLYEVLAANLKARTVVYKHRDQRLIIGRRHFELTARLGLIFVTEIGRAPTVAVLQDTGLRDVAKVCRAIRSYLSTDILAPDAISASLASAGALPELNGIGNPTKSGSYTAHGRTFSCVLNDQQHTILLATRPGIMGYDSYWATSPEAIPPSSPSAEGMAVEVDC